MEGPARKRPTMTSRASSITSALAHRQGFHGQVHAVNDQPSSQLANSRSADHFAIHTGDCATASTFIPSDRPIPTPARGGARLGGTPTHHRQFVRGQRTTHGAILIAMHEKSFPGRGRASDAGRAGRDGRGRAGLCCARAGHLPDRAAGVIGDEERPVRSDGERGRPPPHIGPPRPRPRSRS